MDQYIIGTDIKKADYDRALSLISKELNLPVETIRERYSIAQDVLLVGAYPTPENSTITFNINDGTGSFVPGSKLLAKNDLFIADGFGLRFKKCDWASGVYSNHGNYRLYTDVDPAFFSYTKASSKSEAQALNCVLNGWWSLKVGSTIKVDRHLAQELTYSPTSTYTATANPGFAGGEINTRGFLHTVPGHILSGGDDNVATIDLALGEKSNIDGNISSASTASTTRNVIYLAISGWSIKAIGSGADACTTRTI